MKTLLNISILSISLGISASTLANKYDEINLRQQVDNESRNKIAEARLRGLLADSDSGSGRVGGQRDCVMQIGNQ